MNEPMANGYSFSNNTQQELFNKYQNDRMKMIFILFLFCALDECIRKANNHSEYFPYFPKYAISSWISHGIVACYKQEWVKHYAAAD